jgi:hypothetical protein
MSYSYLKVSMGFVVAARIVCQLIVNNAINITLIPERMNIHQERDV